MDYKKTNAASTTVVRDLEKLWAETGNIYESIAIMGKRANQISVDIKNDAIQEFIEGKIYYRNPTKDKEKMDL